MNMLIPLLYTLGFALLGYLCGSLPFAIWITRLFKGVDVREAGSGHATTTNTIRAALVVVGHHWRLPPSPSAAAEPRAVSTLFSRRETY